MIKPNALRIGNFVQYIARDAQCEKESVLVGKVVSIETNSTTPKLWIEAGGTNMERRQVRGLTLISDPENSPVVNGIVLNSEWLGKFGWRPVKLKLDTHIHDQWKLDRFVLEKIGKYYHLEFYRHFKSRNIIPGEIGFVHQLQNHYYTLTYAELVCKGNEVDI